MQFQCLPFGLCTAPFTFSKVTKPATQFLRQLGIHLIIYLDDLLLAAPTKDQLLVDLSTAIWLLTTLGFLINIPKSITAPTCHLEFLGFIVDTDNMVISLPAHKLHCIQKEASHLLSLDRIPMRTLACFIGTLVATKPAVWTDPLHYRALQDKKIRSLHQHPHYQGSVSLSKEAQVDLQWWCSELPSHCSAPIWKPEASTVIESDASKLGWGAVCQGVPTGGRWTLEETQVPHQLFGAQSNVSGLAVLSEGQNRYSSTGQVRQSHCNSLFEQAWQSVEIPTVSVGPGDLEVVPPTSDYITCTVSGREGQCLGRLGVSPPRQQRLATPTISLRCCPPPPWSFYNRPICEQNECSAARLLQLETRPTGKSGRCLFNILVARPALSLPPLQPDWQSTVEDLPGRGRLCLSNSPNLASSSVVLPGIENVSEEFHSTPHGTGFAPEFRSEAPSSNPGELDVFSCMACLRQAFSTQGFSERVTELLLHSWRSNTHAAYNSAWSKWCGWCAGRHINPLSASLGNVLEFLADQFDLGLQYRSLNTLRSAISTSHPQLDNVNVGSHPLVSRLLKGMFNARPPAPRLSVS